MKRWIWPVAAAATLGLAGCGSSGAATGSTSGTGASAATTPPTSAPPTTSGTSGASGGTGTSGASANTATGGTSGGAVPECTTSQLAGSLTGANGTAGSVYYDLLLTNRGSSACYVVGYPGVSFVTGSNGTQVGRSATRQSDPNAPGTPQVTLAPGTSAASVLRIVDVGNYSSSTCNPTNVPGIRVYPPDQTAALFVPTTQRACASKSVHVLTIEPLHAR